MLEHSEKNITFHCFGPQDAGNNGPQLFVGFAETGEVVNARVQILMVRIAATDGFLNRTDGAV